MAWEIFNTKKVREKSGNFMTLVALSVAGVFIHFKRLKMLIFFSLTLPARYN